MTTAPAQHMQCMEVWGGSQIASIDLLVKAGADINAHDNRGQTALHGAALFGYDDVIKDLVAHNADVNAKDNKGMTPLDSAMGRAGGHGRGGTSNGRGI